MTAWSCPARITNTARALRFCTIARPVGGCRATLAKVAGTAVGGRRPADRAVRPPGLGVEPATRWHAGNDRSAVEAMPCAVAARSDTRRYDGHAMVPRRGAFSIVACLLDDGGDDGRGHSLDTLATTAGRSRSASAARFAEAFGHSPMALPREMRLRRAATLLADTTLRFKAWPAALATLVAATSLAHSGTSTAKAQRRSGPVSAARPPPEGRGRFERAIAERYFLVSSHRPERPRTRRRL